MTHSFYISFPGHYFKKGDIIQRTEGKCLMVLKTYYPTRWSKLLALLGYKIKDRDVIKVKLI
jgi:hypothetical protein